MKTIHKLTTILAIITTIAALLIVFKSQLTQLTYYLLIDQTTGLIQSSGLGLILCFFIGLGFILYFLVQDVVIGFLNENKIIVSIEDEII